MNFSINKPSSVMVAKSTWLGIGLICFFGAEHYGNAVGYVIGAVALYRFHLITMLQTASTGAFLAIHAYEQSQPSINHEAEITNQTSRETRVLNGGLFSQIMTEADG
jgi:hypothetical protein